MHETDPDLIPIPEAAAKWGWNVKRLRGRIYRNRVGDPIGSLATDQVYTWSMREADATSAAP